jgi:hypothetical protein
VGAHPLPQTPTPLAVHHAWRLEPSDRRCTGCDLMPARKAVGFRNFIRMFLATVPRDADVAIWVSVSLPRRLLGAVS